MDPTVALPPVSENVVNLAYADLAIYIFALPPTIWIAWQHGKAGLTAWPLLISFYFTRYVSDIYQVVRRHDPLLPDVVFIMTKAGAIACLTLTLIGLIYEANVLLPHPSRRRWSEKIILGVLHLTNTTGIAIATYGGSPSATNKGGVINQDLDRIGNCIMLVVMFSLCLWVYPTYTRIRTHYGHHNARRARILLITALAGLPFQSVRLAYNTTYSFLGILSLDPFLGSFASKFVLIFGTQLILVLSMLWGGWLSMPSPPKESIDELERREDNTETSAGDRTV